MPSNVGLLSGLGAGIARGMEMGLQNKMLEEREARQNSVRTVEMLLKMAATPGMKIESSVKYLNQIPRFAKQGQLGEFPMVTAQDFEDNKDTFKALGKALSDKDTTLFSALIGELSGSLTAGEKASLDLMKKQHMATQKQQEREATGGRVAGVLRDRSMTMQSEPLPGELQGPTGPTPQSERMGLVADLVQAGVQPTSAMSILNTSQPKPAEYKPPTPASRRLDIQEKEKADEKAKQKEISRMNELILSAEGDGYKYTGEKEKGPDGVLYPVVTDKQGRKGIWTGK